ncbi:MAG: MauE/DoxX family redox-associated membrane protein [Bacteroidota bacterium]
MKFLIENNYIVLPSRLFVGFIFVLASINKIADPNAFAVSIANYKIIEPPLTLLIATVLPWIELLCGLCLLFGIMMRGSSFLVMIMLIVFTAGVISGIVRGLDISCGCFSQDPAVGKLGWTKILENLTLIAISMFLWYAKSDRFSLTHTSE